MKKKDKTRLNKAVLFLVIAFVIAGGIIVGRDYFKKTQNFYTYKGESGESFTFEKYKIENNTFHIIRIYTTTGDKTKEYKISVHYSPYDLEDIPMEANLRDKILTKNWIYLTEDPDLQNKSNGRALLSLIEIGRVTGTSDSGVYQINTQAAFTRESNVTSVPVKNCSNADKNTAVIEARLGNETKIYSERECVIYMGSSNEDLVKASDKLTLHLLGVF